MKWYKKIRTSCDLGLALFGLGACSNDGKSADGTVTIEYFNQKRNDQNLGKKSRVILKEKTQGQVKVVNVPNGGEMNPEKHVFSQGMCQI